MLIMISGVTASNFSQLACRFLKMCQKQPDATRIKSIPHVDQRKTLRMIFFFKFNTNIVPKIGDLRNARLSTY